MFLMFFCFFALVGGQMSRVQFESLYQNKFNKVTKINTKILKKNEKHKILFHKIKCILF